MINWIKSLEIFKEVVIIFNFMLSIMFIGIFFSTIMAVAFHVNELVHYYHNITPFSDDILKLSKKVKNVIMYADLLLITSFVCIVTISGLKKIWVFGFKEIFEKEK